MKTSRVFAALLVLTTLLSMLAGCSADPEPSTTADNCEHLWYSATCDAPKTCSICGKVEGTKLVHQWTDADCTHAKSCYLCGKTDGEALGHQWTEGDCETAQVCTVCSASNGDAPGHVWQPATVDDPKTCKICGKTEGEKIQVDSRFKTANCKHLFGVWTATYENDLTDYGFDGLVATMNMTLEFCNDGTLISTVQLANAAAFEQELIAQLEPILYETYQQQMGVSKEQLDAMLAQQGLTMADMCKETAKNMIDSFHTSQEMVYYVEDGVIYDSTDWDEEMFTEFVLEGDELHMIVEGMDDVIYTRQS